MEEKEIIRNVRGITNIYSERLRELGRTSESVNFALSYLDKKNRSLLGEATEGPSEEERIKAEPAFRLMEEYRQAIKTFFAQNGLLLTSVRDRPPEKYPWGIIPLSRGLLTQYEEEVGDFFFASSTDLKRNAYTIRLNAEGMLELNPITYFFPHANLYAKNGRLILPKPVYIYYLKSDEFTPVVTIRRGRNEKPYFKFGDEWIIPRDIDITKDVVDIKEYRDATPLLSNAQVISSSDEEIITRIYENFREKVPSRENYILLADSILNGKVQYWNDILKTNNLFGNLLRRLKEQRAETTDIENEIEKLDPSDYFQDF